MKIIKITPHISKFEFPTPELKDLEVAFLEVIEKLKKLRGSAEINPLEN